MLHLLNKLFLIDKLWDSHLHFGMHKKNKNFELQ